MPPHINVFNVIRMVYREISAKGMKVTDFTEAEVSVKNKIVDIFSQLESISDMFNDGAEDTLDFELPLHECDSEDLYFDIDKIMKRLQIKD